MQTHTHTHNYSNFPSLFSSSSSGWHKFRKTNIRTLVSMRSCRPECKAIEITSWIIYSSFRFSCDPFHVKMTSQLPHRLCCELELPDVLHNSCRLADGRRFESNLRVNQPHLGLEVLEHNNGSSVDQSDFSVHFQQTCSELSGVQQGTTSRPEDGEAGNAFHQVSCCNFCFASRLRLNWTHTQLSTFLAVQKSGKKNTPRLRLTQYVRNMPLCVL